ncbi:hypothetical protein H9Y04_40925 [Streptomyces sp. TRM66268-LWL]|uniref:Branched-chain amino acid aminotransferase n=1 Tax=Streptomyces polyasparticus TaxID=2767826 RepID=A0ABR7STV0_9ACTN|nr:hypothetical protein [Streptomyces polyasparticus]MBC9718909.1 hypothetical protein [Streptomyces polyasparticus]
MDVFVDSARVLAGRLRRGLPDPPHSLHLVARVDAAADEGPRGDARFTLTASVEANRAGLTPVQASVDARCTGTGPGRPHPFFVTGPAARACLLTPAIDDGPVIARDTVLRLARVLGFESREETRDAREWREDALSGRVTEAFICTDAALVIPVYALRGPQGTWQIGDGQPGAAAIALRRAMIRLVSGAMRDDEHWLDVLR